MLKALRGTKDILPAEVGIWRHIEQSARDIFSIYNYKEIRTPVIEEASLFIRSIGDATDIVQKEMYVFGDRGGRTIALRPEATASIVRAYLENSLGKENSVTKLFYIGPMFRSERPQKGRQRQFHQLGIEAVGSDSPFLDVEVISLAVKFLEKLGAKGFNLKINTLGCQKDKAEILEKYRNSVKPHLPALCDECKERYSKNVLRIFDCKETSCRDIVKNIELGNFLCPECDAHFNLVKKGLEGLDINFTVDQKIVRGLDYYTKTVFEIIQEDLGAKDAICAGGRYNNLVQEMGGEDTPSVGFAFGMERLILAFKAADVPVNPPLDVFVATIDMELYEEAFKLADKLRGRGLSCDIEYDKKSLKAQMKRAEKSGANFVVIFGADEFRENKVSLRDMNKREQIVVGVEEVGEILKGTIK